MKHMIKVRYTILLVTLVVLLMAPTIRAQEMYDITFAKIQENKAFFDDPRPLYNHLGLEKTVPSEAYNKLVYDPEAMKTVWASVVGFTAPNVVDKVAPQIKPGRYTYNDKEK